jgi:uncharacterized protein YegP (UPF0339 family)
MRNPFSGSAYVIETFHGLDGWHWRIRYRGDVLAASEGYADHTRARTVAEHVAQAGGFKFSDAGDEARVIPKDD